MPIEGGRNLQIRNVFIFFGFASYRSAQSLFYGVGIDNSVHYFQGDKISFAGGYMAFTLNFALVFLKSLEHGKSVSLLLSFSTE